MSDPNQIAASLSRTAADLSMAIANFHDAMMRETLSDEAQQEVISLAGAVEEAVNRMQSITSQIRQL